MPQFTTEDIARGFINQMDKNGVKKAVKELAGLILDERLHGEIDEILEDIRDELRKSKGQVEATARTAYPLSSELKKLLSAKVKKVTDAKTVVLHEELDRSLLGGVKLTAPDMELDLSLKTRLDKLRV